MQPSRIGDAVSDLAHDRTSTSWSGLHCVVLEKPFVQLFLLVPVASPSTRTFLPLPWATYGSGGLRKRDNAEVFARRGSAVEAIDAALHAVERGDPTALRRCIAAMSLARDVLGDIALLSNVDTERPDRSDVATAA